MKKLFLVDVSSLFFRAYYAIPPLTTAEGLPTNALYGFTTMCVRLLRESKPDYIAFCFDRPEPSFRVEMYEDYKANRTEMPDDLEQQIPYIKKIVELLGISALEMPGYEADDLIGTLAVAGEKAGLEVIIVSSDKDFAQLVTDKIQLFDTMKNKKFGPEGVFEKWGIHPKQMIDYLSMVGDSSDNIPGVRGVGPKGATKLLAEYKTLDGVYKNIDKIKGALQTKLIEGKKNAELAKKLVTIVTDLKLELAPKDLALRPLKKDQLKELFEKLEFTAMLRKLTGDETAAAAPTKAEKKSSPKASSKSSDKKTESVKVSAPPPNSSEVLTWSLSELQEKLPAYSELWSVHTERGFSFCVDGQSFQVNGEAESLGQILSEKKLQWKGFDLKTTWELLKIKDPEKPVWDNMLAAYVLKAGNTEDPEAVYKMLFDSKWPDLMSPSESLNLHMQMEVELRKRLEEKSGLSVLEKMELPLVPILYSMERRGILIDVDNLHKQSKTLEADIGKLEKDIYKMAGETFNIASPKQLAVVLFEKLKVPIGKKTKTGFSTGSDVLEKNAAEFPICSKIIDFRELSKLRSTYVDALPSLVNQEDGRLHTHFHQALTSTGRLSSSNPNLQNIPIRTERGRLVRQAFVPQKGHKIVSVDYSQIELRVLAEISGDPNMRRAFVEGKDVHAATAAEIFGVKLEDVNPDQRRMAKAVNFGIAYGQGAFGLAEQLGLSRQESKEIIENYFRKFKKVQDYMLETVQRANEVGYVETLFGRRRYLDELKSSNQMVRKFGERAAINAPMQGTASDLVKLAMIEVFESVSAPMLLQVHDELLFEIPENEIQEQVKEIKKIMEGVAKFSVPLVVNVAWGDNWDEAH